MTQMIRAIWPSYLNIPNHLPASAGITTQQMLSHFIFWSIQFPILLIAPHKLKWFFVFKAVVVLIVCTATVIAMTVKAGGSGDIWDQKYTVYGSERSWLTLASMMSVASGWATMATNVPDFTRYLKSSRGVYWQGLFLPMIGLILGLFGIICCSAAKVVYGEYIWDPVDLASRWDGPAGRCGAFFVGLCWVVAQIGTNLSANVISYANDMLSLFPKYINIRLVSLKVLLIIADISQSRSDLRDHHSRLDHGSLEDSELCVELTDVHVWPRHLSGAHLLHTGLRLLASQAQEPRCTQSL